MDLLFEQPHHPATLLNLHRKTFLLRPRLGHIPTLCDWLLPALLPGHQVLHLHDHGDTDLLLHLPALLSRNLAAFHIWLDKGSAWGSVGVNI